MTWPEAVIQMKSWYEQNIHDYSQGRAKDPMPCFTMCNIPGAGNCRHDCSGFVSACLRVFGAFPANYTSCSAMMLPGATDGKRLQSAGFQALSYNIETAQPFDIFVLNGHTEIYAGNRRSYNWGSCHDIAHGGMPSGTSHLSKGYEVMYRYPNLDYSNMPSGGGSCGGPGGFQGLTGEALAAKCPDKIELKGMWSRYQLQMGERSEALMSFWSAPSGSIDGLDPAGGVYDIPNGFPSDSQIQKYLYNCEGHVTVKWATSPDGQPIADGVCPGYDLPGGVHAKAIMDAAGLTPELALGGRSLNQVNYTFCRSGMGSEHGNAYTAYLNRPGKYSSDLEPPVEYWNKLIPYYRDRIIEGWNQPIAQREPDLARRWALCHGMCWGYSHGYKKKVYQSYANYATTDDFIKNAGLESFIKNAYKHGVTVAGKVLRGGS